MTVLELDITGKNLDSIQHQAVRKARQLWNVPMGPACHYPKPYVVDIVTAEPAAENVSGEVELWSAHVEVRLDDPNGIDINDVEIAEERPKRRWRKGNR